MSIDPTFCSAKQQLNKATSTKTSDAMKRELVANYVKETSLSSKVGNNHNLDKKIVGFLIS